MSDQDGAPDPIHKAYVEAEAVLSDDAARAARRARVLAAVARETETPIAASSPSPRRPVRRYAGWLAAASVAGLSVWVSAQLYQPPPRQQPAAPTSTSPAPAVQAPAIAAAPSQLPAPSRTPDKASSAPLAAASAPPPPTALIAPPPAAAPPADVAPPPPAVIAPVERPAPPPADLSSPPPIAIAPIERVAPPAPRQAFPAGAVDARASALAAGAPLQSDPAARLRAAAAAGRLDDVQALLAQGVLVDAADGEGRTALMQSIQADRPAVAVALRKRGASLDQKDHAGQSARDMAAAKGDAALNQALGLAP